jgi:hypothetical protein
MSLTDADVDGPGGGMACTGSNVRREAGESENVRDIYHLAGHS